MAFRSESNDSLAAPELASKEFATEEDRKRHEAVREVITTEKKYCDDLKTIIEVIIECHVIF